VTKREQKIKDKAIKHYEKMIAFAKMQDPKKEADDYIMQYYIGENWEGDYCEYCNNYECYECNLSALIKRGERGSACCMGLYNSMAYAKTWKTWIPRAEKVKAYIEVHG